MANNQIKYDISTVAGMLRVIGDTNRLHILSLLSHKELCVCEITSILKTTQSNVSQHLAKLKSAGLVNERRDAQWVYYSLNLKALPVIQDILNLMPDVSPELRTIEGLKDNIGCKI